MPEVKPMTGREIEPYYQPDRPHVDDIRLCDPCTPRKRYFRASGNRIHTSVQVDTHIFTQQVVDGDEEYEVVGSLNGEWVESYRDEKHDKDYFKLSRPIMLSDGTAIPFEPDLQNLEPEVVEQLHETAKAAAIVCRDSCEGRTVCPVTQAAADFMVQHFLYNPRMTPDLKIIS